MQILSYGYQSILGRSNSETMMAGRRKCDDCDDCDEYDIYDCDEDLECDKFLPGGGCWCDEDDCDCHCEYDD